VQEGSARFDEARCTAESPWIVEGEVERVATATAKEWHPIEQKMVLMTTITGIHLRNTRMVKGVLPAEYQVGRESIRIPHLRCGKRFEQEWMATRTKVRIYGRKDPSTGPRVIVPHHNYVVTLP
jgi:hypothetical protein